MPDSPCGGSASLPLLRSLEEVAVPSLHLRSGVLFSLPRVGAVFLRCLSSLFLLFIWLLIYISVDSWVFRLLFKVGRIQSDFISSLCCPALATGALSVCSCAPWPAPVMVDFLVLSTFFLRGASLGSSCASPTARVRIGRFPYNLILEEGDRDPDLGYGVWPGAGPLPTVLRSSLLLHVVTECCVR